MIPLIPALVLQAPALDLKFQPSGIVDKIGGYAPYGLKLSAEKPAGLTKAPETSTPKYGTAKIGKNEYYVILDGPGKLYVDSNGNGDLTDDPATVWEEKTYKGRNGEEKSYSGFATVEIPYEGAKIPSRIGVYATPDPNDLGFYQDFALVGKITLNGKTFDAIVADGSASYTLDPATKGYELLLVDKDGSGTFHPGFEFNPAREPFNIGGTTYELKADAGKLIVAKSAKTVKEKTLADANPDPNLANGLVPGKAALKFSAKNTAGKAVSFPESYKGKVVLVDFWATWCGPCMREVPNLVKVHNKLRAKGFEVLGITLDEPDMAAKITEVTGKNGMTWPQIYDGKGWEAAIARQYGIKAIPATYLVDGTTGKILAAGDSLRGEKLEGTVLKALAAKK